MDHPTQLSSTPTSPFTASPGSSPHPFETHPCPSAWRSRSLPGWHDPHPAGGLEDASRPPQCWNEDARSCRWSLGASAAPGGKHPKQGAPPPRDAMGTLAQSRGAPLLPGKLAGGSGAVGGPWSHTHHEDGSAPPAGRLGVMLLPWGLLRPLSPVGWREDGSP